MAVSVLPTATAPVAPTPVLSPIANNSIVPASADPMVIVVTALSDPMAPSIVVLPVPELMTKASSPPLVPSIFPSIWIFPHVAPVLIVVVPLVLKTRSPLSKVKLSAAVETVTLATVSLMLPPAADS